MERVKPSPWSRIRPVFWKRCLKCGKQFRDELMYKRTNPAVPDTHTEYRCWQCMSDETKEMLRASKE